MITFASEHHANLLPWRRGTVRHLPIPTSPDAAVGALEAALREAPVGPRLVSVTGASNELIHLDPRSRAPAQSPGSLRAHERREAGSATDAAADDVLPPPLELVGAERETATWGVICTSLVRFLLGECFARRKVQLCRDGAREGRLIGAEQLHRPILLRHPGLQCVRVL